MIKIWLFMIKFLWRILKRIKMVISIQSHWRGYILRKKLNVFKFLPPDLWNLILHFIKSEESRKIRLNILYSKILINRQMRVNEWW